MSLSRRTLTALGLAAALSAAALPAHAAADPKVKFVTSEGSFTVELYPGKAPKTVENFLQYVKDKHYDGAIFHRVIKSFMVQGGGYGKDYQEKPTRAPIKNEADNGLKNTAGTMAMARRPDPDSATAQFFINVVDNPMLDYRAPTPQGWGYAVFGKVVSGMDTVEKIRNAPTGPGGPFPSDAPQKIIVIESARIVN
ncbi:MAG: peptidylprolyl isomerase [Burkholderiaceae bacterium]|jgi:cyclophilin family peptidyl-prolyl cis-trans isomerase|nr:peptidylprolyl isomerase [Burkholderiaceae bacterium]